MRRRMRERMMRRKMRRKMTKSLGGYHRLLGVRSARELRLTPFLGLIKTRSGIREWGLGDQKHGTGARSREPGDRNKEAEARSQELGDRILETGEWTQRLEECFVLSRTIRCRWRYQRSGEGASSKS